MRPFLKWAGGKYRLVDRIKEKLPPGKRLLEPFAGSCALSINTDYPEYWLNDINQDLINLYRVLHQEGEPFIEYCRGLFQEKYNSAEEYYAIRNRFNLEQDLFQKAAYFIYLNRHGYNGLSRYNSNGDFNVPFGRYKKPYFPEKELLYFVAKLKKATFTCLDFQEMMLSAEPGDVIYCDPPYIPLNETANFTSYSAGGFDQAQQVRLAETASLVAKRGIITVISNHYNDFIMEIYKDAKIDRFPVRRFISCDGANRNEVDEVLAVFG